MAKYIIYRPTQQAMQLALLLSKPVYNLLVNLLNLSQVRWVNTHHIR